MGAFKQITFAVDKLGGFQRTSSGCSAVRKTKCLWCLIYREHIFPSMEEQNCVGIFQKLLFITFWMSIKTQLKSAVHPNLKKMDENDVGASGWRQQNYFVDLEVLWNYSSFQWCRDYICQWLLLLEIKKISSWPAAGAEFLILAIISMTSFPVVGSNLSRRELFVSAGEPSEWLIFVEKDKPIFTKHSLNSCVISQEQSEELEMTSSSLKAVRGRSVVFL